MSKRIEEGITLIALIITIIVLLILAGVTISMLTGENGIISRASSAKTKTEIASIKEEIQMKIVEEQAENNGNISEDKLNEIMANYDKDNKIRDDKGEKYIITENGNKINVSDIFRGTPVEDEQTDIKVANKPNIDGFDKTKTYYMRWNLNTEKTAYDPEEKKMSENAEPNDWYDYTAGVNQWANIKTIGGENECYWVWIPRYAYKITYAAEDRSSGTIDVVFLKGQTNNDMNGKDVTSSSYVDTKGQTGAYKVHPAFTQIGNGESITNSDGSINTNYVGNGGFGELTGIWVAKFEASSNSISVVENPTEKQLEITGGVTENDKDSNGVQLTNTDLKIRVKPNVTSWRGITLNDIFKVCQNLVEPNNSLCSTNNTKNTKLDSHMMKNTEWGAVSYLSRSKYGIKGEVWNNPYYNNTTNRSPITGLCGSASNGKDNATTNISDTIKYNEVGGGNASTTGNVYGVYDMAGGAWDCVAGILSSYKSSGDNTEKNNFYDFSNSSTYPNRYFNWYAGTSDDKNENYNANTGKYGDAVYETSNSGDSNTGSWDSSFSLFIYSSRPVCVRGGGAYNGDYVGAFAFSFVTGQALTFSSFRPVVLSPQM